MFRVLSETMLNVAKGLRLTLNRPSAIAASKGTPPSIVAYQKTRP
jgi:hypothetical protein